MNLAVLARCSGQSAIDNELWTLPNGQRLHQELQSMWQDLAADAHHDGWQPMVVSGYRPFARQLTIWNDKFYGKRQVVDQHNQAIAMDRLDDWQKCQAILRFSALPGSSRHHWGCDFDIADGAVLAAGYQLQLTADEYLTGPMRHVYQWLRQHASQYQLAWPYPAHFDQEVGVAFEPWHLSYQPSAARFANISAEQLLDYLLMDQRIAGVDALRENRAQLLPYLRDRTGSQHV